jgi:hypothetical protein
LKVNKLEVIGDLNVSGKTTMNGDLTAKNTTINGNLTAKNTNINGNLTAKTTTLTGDLNIPSNSINAYNINAINNLKSSKVASLKTSISTKGSSMEDGKWLDYLNRQNAQYPSGEYVSGIKWVTHGRGLQTVFSCFKLG